MATPLHIFFQAMGQCSTLPGDGNGGTRGPSSTSQSRHRYGQTSMGRPPRDEQRDSSYNSRVGEDGTSRRNDSDIVMTDGPDQWKSTSSVSRQGSMNRYSTESEEPILIPEGSVRTRCYRLNLDAPVILSPTRDNLGPISYQPPLHLLSHHERKHSREAMMGLYETDSNDGSVKSATQVAIDTARIFRGITVDSKGTIIAQNQRATRSSRGRDTKSKQGEKSRQAAKIDKANDLIDEAIASAGKENSSEKSNLVSLFIVGEYDDMKQLVRDGSKKLKDAEGLPDESLLCFNHSRGVQGSTPTNIPSPSNDSSSVSRSRPHGISSRNSLPKLQSHPRDRPSMRRVSGGAEVATDDKASRNGAGCNDMFFGRGSDLFFNPCGGGSGRKSANGKSYSPSLEGRNESSSRYSRGGMTERDSPGRHDVEIM